MPDSFWSFDDFVREAELPAWTYTGPLEPGIARVHEHCAEVETTKERRVFVVHSVLPSEHGINLCTTADTEEDAWRGHLGVLLLRGVVHPHPDNAQPGETLAALKARVRYVEVSRYPGLRSLSWNLRADAEITEAEALNIYERN